MLAGLHADGSADVERARVGRAGPPAAVGAAMILTILIFEALVVLSTLAVLWGGGFLP